MINLEVSTQNTIEEKYPSASETIQQKNKIEQNTQQDVVEQRSSVDTFVYIQKLRSTVSEKWVWVKSYNEDKPYTTSMHLSADWISIDNNIKIFDEKRDNTTIDGNYIFYPSIEYTVNPKWWWDFTVFTHSNGYSEDSDRIPENWHMTDKEFNENVLPKIKSRIQETKTEIERKQNELKNKAIQYSHLQDQKRLDELEQQINQLA